MTICPILILTYPEAHRIFRTYLDPSGHGTVDVEVRMTACTGLHVLGTVDVEVHTCA